MSLASLKYSSTSIFHFIHFKEACTQQKVLLTYAPFIMHGEKSSRYDEMSSNHISVVL